MNRRFRNVIGLIGWTLVMGCLGPSEFEGDDVGECSDAADNDSDGEFDCDDVDCANSPDCDGTTTGSTTTGALTGTEGLDNFGLMLIVDNSESMAPFVIDLADDVDLAFAPLVGRNVVIGLTTTDVVADAGQGLGGLFTPDQLPALQAALLDHATCGAYGNNCGSGDEEPLEAAYLASCRAALAPATPCTEPVNVASDYFPPTLGVGDLGTLGGLLAGGRPFVTLILSDEGDGSRRMAQGDSDPQPYIDLIGANGHDWISLTLGPPVDAYGAQVCPSGNPDWGIARFVTAASVTDGAYGPVLDASTCDYVDPAFGIATLLDELLSQGAAGQP